MDKHMLISLFHPQLDYGRTNIYTYANGTHKTGMEIAREEKKRINDLLDDKMWKL